jgi:hypothetical protein
MQCAQCGKAFDPEIREGRVASISGSIMGDEHIETAYFCRACGQYTIEVVRDRFLGETEISVFGPLSKAEGDARVALIRECVEPWNKRCRCAAHWKYFDGWLD